MFGASVTKLIILNEEMDHITKTVKYLQESGFLIRGVSQAIKIETKVYY